MPRGVPRRVPPPTEEQVRRLAAACWEIEPAVGAAVMQAAYSGARLDEGRMIDWQDLKEEVKGANGETYARLRIRFGKGENGSGPRPRDTILLPEGLEALRALPGYALRVPHHPILLRINGWAAGKRWSYSALKVAWRDGREAAGPDVAGVIFHDLRKFYASRLLNRGVSDMDVAVALGHIDRKGRPNTALVREIYGFVELDASLNRVAEVMTGGGVFSGQVVEAADGRVGEGQRGPVGARGVEARDRGGAGQSGGGGQGAGASVRVDEGVGRVACDARRRSGQGGQGSAFALRVALEDARRSQREAASGVDGELAGA